MKKYLFVFIFLILPFVTNGATVSMVNTNINTEQVIEATIICDTYDEIVALIDSEGVFIDYLRCSDSPINVGNTIDTSWGTETFNWTINTKTAYMAVPNKEGIYTWESFNFSPAINDCFFYDGVSSTEPCMTNTYTYGYTDNSVNAFQVISTFNVHSTNNGVPSIIENANIGYSTVVGENINATTQWAGDNLIKLFIGSGLSVLYYLRYWIVALVIIFLIVFFYKRTKLNNDSFSGYTKPWSKMSRLEKNEAHKREGKFWTW